MFWARNFHSSRWFQSRVQIEEFFFFFALVIFEDIREVRFPVFFLHFLTFVHFFVIIVFGKSLSFSGLAN